MEHWNNIYATKAVDNVSWYVEDMRTTPDFRLITQRVGKDGSVLDVGAGASYLIDTLLQSGWSDVTVSDLSHEAMSITEKRVKETLPAPQTASARFLTANVLELEPRGDGTRYTCWHDRAVLHFLTDDADIARYAQAVKRCVAPQGYVVLATFAKGGPEKCSGLPIRQYDAQGMATMLGSDFELLSEEKYEHRTPWDSTQLFQYAVFRKTV